jgi:hypothetical protein
MIILPLLVNWFLKLVRSKSTRQVDYWKTAMAANKSFQGTSEQRGFLKFSLAAQIPSYSKSIAVNPACS